MSAALHIRGIRMYCNVLSLGFDDCRGCGDGVAITFGRTNLRRESVVRVLSTK